jgi:hypothetical protein
LKVFDDPGGLGELGADTAADPGTCPVSVMELKIPALLAEIVTALIVIPAPLVLVTEKAPALDMLAPEATVIATVEVTATLICARATPATPAMQQAMKATNQTLGRRFTASPPCEFLEFSTNLGAGERGSEAILA